jgi:lipopolysaccharide biosynthesis glycosyltransferase
MSAETLELVCAADERFLPHAATMLLSVIEKTRAPVRVHFLHRDGLSAGAIDLLKQMLDASGTPLQTYAISDEMVRQKIGESRPYAYWYRLLFPELAPDLDKVLYLDCDIIVVDDLMPLWRMDISDYLWGAVCNPLYPSMEPWPLSDLGLPTLGDYVNSGMLLMNLARMREERVIEKIRGYVSQHAKINCPDQDTINALFYRQCLMLHPRWNLQTTFYELAPRQIPVPAEQIREALANPAIVHFISISKPWHYLSRHPLRHLYAQYRAKTPWPDYELEGREFIYRLIRPLPPTLQYRVFDWLVAAKSLKQRMAKFASSGRA